MGTYPLEVHVQQAEKDAPQGVQQHHEAAKSSSFSSELLGQPVLVSPPGLVLGGCAAGCCTGNNAGSSLTSQGVKMFQ
jgi:hypothetical protein